MSTLIKEEQNLEKTQNLKLVNADRKDREQLIEAQNIQNKLEDFILKNDHPCLMAKSVFDSGRYLFGMYQELGNPVNASQIHKDLHEF
ncbi:MAG: YqcI/YcgG family protein, partial [Bacteroidota bacterium]|nr:YqcI/YcgG family protein [Bacteroidota bacterium]